MALFTQIPQQSITLRRSVYFPRRGFRYDQVTFNFCVGEEVDACRSEVSIKSKASLIDKLVKVPAPEIGPQIVNGGESLVDGSEGVGVSDGVSAESLPFIWFLRWFNKAPERGLRDAKRIDQTLVVDQFLLVKWQPAHGAQHLERAGQTVRARLGHRASPALERDDDVQTALQDQAVESGVVGYKQHILVVYVL
jgi:hypothetical protein